MNFFFKKYYLKVTGSQPNTNQGFQGSNAEAIEGSQKESSEEENESQPQGQSQGFLPPSPPPGQWLPPRHGGRQGDSSWNNFNNGRRDIGSSRGMRHDSWQNEQVDNSGIEQRFQRRQQHQINQMGQLKIVFNTEFPRIFKY